MMSHFSDLNELRKRNTLPK